MIVNALIVAGATLAVGVVAGALLRTLSSVRLQLAALALLAVVLPLGAVLLSGTVMLHIGAEGEVVAVSVAAGAVSLAMALVLGPRNIIGPLEHVREASVRLTQGELSERAPVRGPAEIAELARSFNAMAEHLETVFDGRRELIAWASRRSPAHRSRRSKRCWRRSTTASSTPATIWRRSKVRCGCSVLWSTISSSWRASTPVPSPSS